METRHSLVRRMKKQMSAAIVLSVLVLCGASLVLRDGGRKAVGAETQAEAGGCYEPVAPLSNVMEVMNDIFYKMPDRVKSAQPKDFKALKRESFFVAEIANLAGRVKDRCSNKEWVEIATQMKTAALGMAEAAGKSDGDGFKKLYDKAKESCSSCHDKFRD